MAPRGRAPRPSSAVLALSLLAVAATQPGLGAEVTQIPGWDGPPPSRSWSGYLDGTPPGESVPVHSHYWLLESEGDPATDPLIVWTNGGPGASSMFGLLVELGPLMLTGESLRTAAYNRTGVPSLFRNEYGWTKLGSLLVYNAPAPVGYSFCGDDPAGGPRSCGAWDDTRTARSNHALLRSFMAAHPRFQGRDVYIVGESYAGVYVPTLVREILKEGPGSPIRLKGFAVGDGCVGSDVLCFDHAGPLFHMEFMHGHGQFSEELYDKIMRVCSMDELRNGVHNPVCAALLDQMDKEVGGYFEYALYDECTYENALYGPRRPPVDLSWRRVRAPLPTHVASRARLGGAVNDYPCGGGPALDVWVNQTAVKRALHVPDSARFYSFDNAQEFEYDFTERNLIPFYRFATLFTPLRVLVYNGDTDPALNSLAAQNWTKAIGLRTLESWRPWTLDGRQKMGGYVTTYEGNFSFVTIRGAGHMVPEHKPAASLEFLRTWLAGDRLKPYVKPRG